MSNELPRGLRNNNPGNIRVVKGQVWQGEITGSRKKDKSFCEFVTIAHGYRALIKLLQNYRRKNGLNTLRQMILRAGCGQPGHHVCHGRRHQRNGKRNPGPDA